ncbi:MAG: glycerol-3-phosphate 1-O-acyltransferase PlsY [Candidatus Alkaliphilus sp. MAG34]|nr:glycerol-3-phosphate 1-O-acyltransferase PlsY [Clostridiales bacterium]
MFKNLLLILISYLIGSLSTSYLIAKFFAKIDIREHGSGNPGSANILRTLGAKAAILTFLGDLFKGAIAVYLGNMLGGTIMALLCGIAVVIGHNWPVFLEFKGGKGIATTIGVIILVKPLVALVCISIGVAMLFKFKYVSLASIVGVVILPFVIIIYGFNYFLFGLILALLAVYRHRENIKRLLEGNERKIGEKSSVN